MATPAHRVRGLQLTPKVVLLVLVVSAVVFLMIQAVQSAQLRAMFNRELTDQLERQAPEDRALFDRRVQLLRQSAKLIVSQKRFLDYVGDPAWLQGPATPREVYTTPPWLPPTSVLRSFYIARHALLVDPAGRVRQIYDAGTPAAEPNLAKSLLHPGRLLRKLSHNQSYMTSLGGVPMVIAAEPVSGEDGRPLATLLLTAPIDDGFLRGAVGLFHQSSIIALIDPATGKVVASSRDDVIRDGARLSRLKRDYLMIGRSFFDYGASDLGLQFASFIPLSRRAEMVEKELAADTNQRLFLGSALLLAFAGVTAWAARRVRRLTQRVEGFAASELGFLPAGQDHGDELHVLERRFDQLAEEVMQTRDALRREAQEKVNLAQRAVLAAQRTREVKSLQALTETLQVGVMLVDAGRPTAFNLVMEHFAVECGGEAHFGLPADIDEVERELVDGRGETRVFRISRHRTIGEEAILVREVTEQRRAERERNLFASFPAGNPNPVLRVDAAGNIQYANDPAQALLRLAGAEGAARLPPEWQQRFEELLAGRLVSHGEVMVGELTYSFVAAHIEGSEFLYLYGFDITEQKRGERERQLSAAITANVLDGIMVTDVDGHIEMVNPAFTTITGYTAEQAIGSTPRLLKSRRHDEAFYNVLWSALRNKGEWSGEIWNRRSSGEVFPSLTRISAIRDERGAVRSYVAVFSDISDIKAHQERLSHMAYHDALTGLPNRILLVDRLSQTAGLATRGGDRAALLYLDLDGFKQVNDSLGHDVGDLLLQDAAERLRACVRASDTVSRLGGDEFALILQEIKDSTQATAVASKVCVSLSEPFELNGHRVEISVSVGIAIVPDHGNSAEDLLKGADMAMYQAKQNGKNGYCLTVA